MGRTTITVTPELLNDLFQFAIGTEIVEVGPLADWQEKCLDFVIEGPNVPDAYRSELVIHKEKRSFEFKPIQWEFTLKKRATTANHGT